jgi:hypothetical protein
MSDGVEVITMDGRAVGAAQNATSPTVAYTRPPSAMETRQAPTPPTPGLVTHVSARVPKRARLRSLASPFEAGRLERCL